MSQFILTFVLRKQQNMKYIIEDWWRHNGCYDREQASGIPYEENEDNYLEITDEWWNSLTDGEKERVYDDFFEEF